MTTSTTSESTSRRSRRRRMGSAPAAGVDEPAAAAAGAPPGARVSVLQSARRHWLLVAVPVVLLMALGYVAGHSRSPTYTSESRLNVGRIDVTSQAIPGFVAGTQSLAATYSRAVNATDVLRPVAERLGVPVGAIAGRVSAAPIPSSSLFRVSATGPTSNEAIELANLVTASLVKYVAQVNDASPDAKRLLGEIEDASAALADARAASRAAVAAYGRNPTPAANALVTRREAAQYAAGIRLQTVTDAYRTSQQGISQSEIVQVLNPASAAASDEGAVTQKLLFVGLIGGLAIGLALATARANWRR